MINTYMIGLAVIVLISIASNYAMYILGWTSFTPWTIVATTWLLFAGSVVLNIILRSVPVVYLSEYDEEQQ